ncbi:hypothetical protein HAX54_029791, partial [Datura stramonium]|nr:hypothetical protein [Datura stramonium]
THYGSQDTAKVDPTVTLLVHYSGPPTVVIVSLQWPPTMLILEENNARSLEEKVVLQSIRKRNDVKYLSYIPPVMKDRLVTITIEEDDIKMQLEIWESSLIGTNLSVILTWVKFPGLLVAYWPAEELCKMANAMGRPLYVDSFTANAEKISYVKVLVEVHVS